MTSNIQNNKDPVSYIHHVIESGRNEHEIILTAINCIKQIEGSKLGTQEKSIKIHGIKNELRLYGERNVKLGEDFKNLQNLISEKTKMLDDALNFTIKKGGGEYVVEHRQTHAKMHIKVSDPEKPGIQTSIADLASEIFLKNPHARRTDLYFTVSPESLERINDAALTALSQWQKQEKIPAATVLHQPVFMNERPSSDMRDPKLFAHIHGNLFLTSTGLEGSFEKHMMAYLTNFLTRKLKELGETKPRDENQIAQMNRLLATLQRGLNTIKDFPWAVSSGKSEEIEALKSKFLPAMKEAISKLSAGESFLIPFGWDQHAIYMEIVKGADNTFKAIIYNTGDGLDYHSQMNILAPNPEEGKPKYINKFLPFIEIVGIKESTMNDDFLTALLQLKYVTFKAPHAAVNADDIYNKFLPTLGGTRIIPLGKPDEYILPQESGICTFTGLCAAVRHYLPKEYPRLEFEIRRESLRDFFLTHKGNFKSDEKIRLLCFKSLVQFAHDIPQQYDEGIISSKELAELTFQIDGMMRFIKDIEDRLLKEQEAAAPRNPFTAVSQPHYGFLRSWETENLTSAATMDLKGLAFDLHWNPQWKPAADTFGAELEKFTKQCSEALKKGKAQQTNVFITELFTALPQLDDPFWDQIPVNQIPNVMEAIANLSELSLNVFNRLNAGSVPVAQRMDHLIGLAKGFALQHRLAARDKELVETFGLKGWRFSSSFANWHKEVEDINTGQFELLADKNFYSATQLQQMNDIRSYLDKILPGSDDKDFFCHRDSYKHRRTINDGITPENILEKGFLLKYFLNHREELAKKIKADPDFINATKGHTKISDEAFATFLLSDLTGKYLPKAYCALQRQHMIASLSEQGYYPEKLHFRFFYNKEETRFETKLVLPEAPVSCFPHAGGVNNSDYVHKEGIPTLFNHQNIEALQKEYSEVPKGVHYTQKEWVDLKSIFCHLNDTGKGDGGPYPSALPLIHAIEYFSDFSNLEKLADHDTGVFFKQILFMQDHLSTLILNNPSYGQKMFSFIQDSYNHFRDHQNIKGAAFILQIAQLFVGRIKGANRPEFTLLLQRIEKEGIDSEHRQIEECLDHLLPKTSDPVEKGLVCRQLLSHYCQKRKNLSENEILKCAALFTYLSIHPLPDDQYVGHLEYDLKTLHMGTVLPKLCEMLQNPAKNKTVLQAMTHLLDAEFKKVTSNDIKWVFTAPILVGNKGEWVVHLEHMVIFKGGQKTMQIPHAITNHLHFKENFPKKTYMGQYIGNNIYQFTDPPGGLVQVRLTEDNLIIQRQHRGIWYQYTSKDKLDGILNSSQLENDKTHWVNCKNSKEVLFCDKGTFSITHRIIPTGFFGNHYEMIQEKHPQLRLLNNIDKQKPPYNTLLNLESQKHIHVWIDQKGQPQEIEFPRLALSFKFEPRPGLQGLHARSVQFGDYYISQNQVIGSLGNFKEYLVLENAKGEKKVILPRKDIYLQPEEIATDRGSLTTGMRLVDDFPDTPKRVSNYCFYDVDKEGNLSSRHAHHNLYLAFLHMGRRQYDQAMKCLEKADKHKAYTSSEREVFKWLFSFFIQVKCLTVQSRATLLKTFALFWGNLQRHGKLNQDWRISQKHDRSYEMEVVKEAYEFYLSYMQYSPAFKLESKEEVQLLVELINHFPQEQLFKARLLELNPSHPKVNFVTVESGKKLQSIDLTSFENNLEIAIDRWGNLFEPNVKFLVRPPEENLPFKTLYEQAKTQKNLAMQFKLQAAFGNAKQSNVYAFLAVVAENPQDYPPYEELEAGLKAKSAAFSQVAQTFKKQYAASIPPVEAVKEEEIKSMESAFRKQYDVAAPPPLQREGIKPSETVVLTRIDKQPISFAHLFKQEVSEPALLSAKEIEDIQKEISSTTAGKMQEREAKRLSEGLATYCQSRSAPLQRLAKINNRVELTKELTVMQEQLSSNASAMHARTENLRTKVLALANKGSEMQSIESIKQTAALLAKQESPKKPFQSFSIEDLFVCYLKGDTAEIVKRNPNILEDIKIQRPDLHYKPNNDPEIQKEIQKFVQKLQSELIAFLISSVEEKQVFRQFQAVKAISDHVNGLPKNTHLETDPTLQELTNNAFQQFQETSAYDRTLHLPFLIFEHYGDFLLRKDQVEDLQTLIKAEPEKLNFKIMQKIMGSGKTKVLLPILLLLMADRKHLPIAIVPEQLYKTVVKDLSQSMRAFQKVIHTMPFERDDVKFKPETVDASIKRLQHMNEQLQQYVESGEALIITSKTAQSIGLKFHEALHEYQKSNGQDKKIYECIKLLHNILKIFKESQAIIDEVDIIFNTRHEVHFTIGDPHEIHQQRSQLVSSIYEQILSNPALKALIPKESLSDGSLLTHRDYHKDIKPILIKAVIAARNADDPIRKLLESQDQTFGTLLSKQCLWNYLMGNASQDDEEFIKNYAPLKDSLDLLAVFKEEINHILPLTLSKSCDVRYGPSVNHAARKGSKKIAIPYDGNNNPVESSDYGNPYELLNYTIQMYCKTGITKQMIRDDILQMRKDYAKEKEANPLMKDEETAAFKSFEKLSQRKDLNLFNCKDDDIAAISKQITDTPSLFFSYLKTFIYPEIAMYSKQLSSNPLDLFDLFKSAIGFTGTPWNVDTYPEKIRPHTIVDPIIDGKTAAILTQMTRNQTQHILQSQKYPQVLEELLKEQPFHAIIDTGALFKGIDNETVARDLLQRLPADKKAVIFYKNNKLHLLERGMKQSASIDQIEKLNERIKPEERFTYYDQPHTTGADIPQAHFANARVTIGKDITMRDLFQGVWRMRGLDKNQRVSFAIDREADASIRKLLNLKRDDKIEFKHILKFAFQNQLNLQTAHLITSTKQKIGHILKKAANDQLMHLDYNKPEDVLKFIQNNEKIFTANIEDRPFETYGKREQFLPKEEILDALKSGPLNMAKSIAGSSEKFEKEISAQIDAEVAQIAHLLPNKLSTHMLGGLQSETQVEREQEQEQELSLEAVKSSETYDDDLFAHRRRKWWHNTSNINEAPRLFSKNSLKPITQEQTMLLEKDQFWSSHPTVMGIETLAEMAPELRKFAPIFKGLTASENRLPAAYGKPRALTQMQPPTEYLLAIKHPDGTVNMQLLDRVYDLTFFYNALTLDKKGQYPHSDNRETQLCLVTLKGKMIQSDKNFQNDPAFERSLIKMRVKTKLYLGEIHFSKDEILALKEIINEVSPKLIREYFTEQIFTRYPERQQAFKDSLLAKLI